MALPGDDSIYAEVLYDLFQVDRDYAADIAALRDLAQTRRPSASTWLDVACGTGHHLAGLRHAFKAAGVDISAEMLAARRNVGPSVRLTEGDLTSLVLGETFDVVSCLASSICHAETADGLARAVARMGAHVRADGLLLVERYFSAEEWDDSRVGVRHVEDGPLRGSQYHVSRRDGPLAELHVHYVLGRPGLVQYDDEYFRVGLFSDEDYDAAFEGAGFAHRELLEDALTGRGLYVASRAPLLA